MFYNYKTGIPEDVVYAKVTFDEILGVAEGTKAQLGIKGTWTDSEGVEKGYKYSGTVGKINSINNRYLLPGSRILLARYDDNITSIRVKFTYYREQTTTSTCMASDTRYTQTIGSGRDWMEITKAPDNTPDGQVYYYYTVLDQNDQPITGYRVLKNGVAVSGSDVTDREGTAVKIKAGDKVRLEGLSAGSYKIMETIDRGTPAAFQMAVEETESTTSQAPVDVEVLGPRSVTITKTPYGPGEEVLDHTYTFQVKDVYGNPVGQKVKLAPGESGVVQLPEAGWYKVEETNKSDAFQLSYTDSGTVGAMTTSTGWKRGRSGRSGTDNTSTVTFTNHFSREEGAYKVIHEYYFRDDDGNYTCEGSSILSSVGGLKLNDTPYTDENVITQNIFGAHAYTYFQSAYGTVSGEDPGAAVFNLATGSDWKPGTEDAVQQPEKAPALPGAKATPSNADKGQSPEQEVKPVNKATPSDLAVTVYTDGETEDDEYDGDMELIDDRATASDWEAILTDDQASPSNALSRSGDGNGAVSGYEGIDDQKSSYDASGIIREGVLLYNGKECTYEPEDGKDHVTATKEGEQVIILRYYRHIPKGSYKILHVYYLRGENGDIREGTSVIMTTDPVDLTAEARKELHKVNVVPQIPHPSVYYNQKGEEMACPYEYVYDGHAYGKVVQGGNVSDDYYVFGSTYRPDDGMQEVYAEHIQQKPEHTPDGTTWYQYKFHNSGYGETGKDGDYEYMPDKEWASSTEHGDQIIILRYVRDGTEKPWEPGKPTPPGGGGGGGGGGNTPPPTPGNPPPETPADPTPPEGGLPDPNDPNSPDTITVWEDGVPKTYIKIWDPEIQEFVYLLEEDVPLGWMDLPKTGDRSRNPLWAVLLLSGAAGALGIMAVRRKDGKHR